MNRYRCDECGCYLDPGEGRLCEECLELKKSRALRMKQSLGIFQETESGQIKMRLQGA